ncbi:hypothetical protein V2G26_001014 [Clonostachys chloroleuca]
MTLGSCIILELQLLAGLCEWHWLLTHAENVSGLRKLHESGELAVVEERVMPFSYHHALRVSIRPGSVAAARVQNYSSLVASGSLEWPGPGVTSTYLPHVFGLFLIEFSFSQK